MRAPDSSNLNLSHTPQTPNPDKPSTMFEQFEFRDLGLGFGRVRGLGFRGYIKFREPKGISYNIPTMATIQVGIEKGRNGLRF